MIEPTEALLGEVSERLKSLLPVTSPCDPAGETLVTDEGGRLMIEWRLYRPPLRAFVNEVASRCPTLVVAQERLLTLDLTGIWREPEAHRRQVLAEAKRLGFGAVCVFLLIRKRNMSFSRATAYMAEVGHRADDQPGCDR